MDLDAYVAAHSREWSRLEQLLSRASRPRRLQGAEVDELVDLYQRVATHLSVVQSSGPDAALVGRLSSLVARARSTVAGGRRTTLSDVARFFTVDFPAICYRTRWWGAGAAAYFLVLSFAIGIFIATSPQAQLAIAPPEDVAQLVNVDFAAYYSSNPAQDFAARVFTNNTFAAAQAILFGVVLGVPVLFVLFNNALNVGVAGGLLAANDRTGLFFGLILPHGIPELTAVFIASGLGLKIGWTVVDPGRRTRSRALAEEGRSLVVGALGLAALLAVAGVIEAYVTPSGLPTAVRVGVGVVAEVLFLSYVVVLGRRADRAGRTGDLVDDLRGQTAPASG